ncbi:MAG: hypothetical protein AB8B96_01750, partial [Lysobacterales bacterium]
MALTLTSTLLSAVLFSQPDPGGDGLHVFPLSTGCTTTLQACIDNAEEGDIVDVATATPIDEDLLINKSLVLRAADGISPVIGAGSTAQTLTVVVVSATATPEQSVTVEGLTLNNTRVFVSFLTASDHSLFLRQNVIQIDDGDVITNGVFIGAEVPAQIVVEDNRIESSGTGLRLQVRSDERVNARIARNVVTTTTPANSTNGLFLELAPASQSQVEVISNIVSGTGSVGSFAAGIKGSVQSNSDLSVSHNTIYATQGMTHGIDLNISADASGALNLINNTVSASTGRGYLVTSQADNGALVTAIEGNHSFANAEADFLFDSTANQPLGT